jgi:hypothetical protein
MTLEGGATSEEPGFPGHESCRITLFATGTGSFRPLPPPRVLTVFGRGQRLLRLESEAFYPRDGLLVACHMRHAYDWDDMHSNSATFERGCPPISARTPNLHFRGWGTPLRDPRHQPPNQV